MSFITEKRQEFLLNTLLVRIPGPNGEYIYRRLTHTAHSGLEAMRDIDEPDEAMVRRAIAMQKRTGLPYEDCFSMVVMAGPVN